MEMEQVIAHLLAQIKAEITNQAKTNVNLRKMKAGQELMKEKMLVKLETALDLDHYTTIL
jgi:hypothetical protein